MSGFLPQVNILYININSRVCTLIKVALVITVLVDMINIISTQIDRQHFTNSKIPLQTSRQAEVRDLLYSQKEMYLCTQIYGHVGHPLVNLTRHHSEGVIQLLKLVA
jgi:hypothetical protein